MPIGGLEAPFLLCFLMDRKLNFKVMCKSLTDLQMLFCDFYQEFLADWLPLSKMVITMKDAVYLRVIRCVYA
ncbi:Uncharacterized protein TCM_041286 [Theobroma cacao]|uniref:Uncharacterized protein n=1 Tax=Theobroma cacao TaxID=3641 RepID=A0A061GVX7_THECC|nr:Uncharacterized protein TCM_041286 [Theobroma cacao]